LTPHRAFLERVTKELLAMNMTSATLFPGLDGFAQNLADLIPFPELRAVDTEVGREEENRRPNTKSLNNVAFRIHTDPKKLTPRDW
jgi:hypothetical protein